MTFSLKPIVFLSLVLFSFKIGKLDILTSIDNTLEEVSAIALVKQSNLYWVIEDAGNKNNLYALNSKGKIEKTITISNAKNVDWEDLTTDSVGNIYIGDFGNNKRKRKEFTIYKVSNTKTIGKNAKAEAEILTFTLPKNIKSEDFESFFLWNDCFYLFSKNHKHTNIFRLENKTGTQVAQLISTHKFKGKDNRITSADISKDGKTVILLNHEKIWQLSNFQGEYFFEGTVKSLNLKHDSQKEGIAFLNNKTIIITDETNKNDGNIYSFGL